MSNQHCSYVTYDTFMHYAKFAEIRVNLLESVLNDATHTINFLVGECRSC